MFLSESLLLSLGRRLLLLLIDLFFQSSLVGVTVSVISVNIFCTDWEPQVAKLGLVLVSLLLDGLSLINLSL